LQVLKENKDKASLEFYVIDGVLKLDQELQITAILEVEQMQCLLAVVNVE